MRPVTGWELFKVDLALFLIRARKCYMRYTLKRSANIMETLNQGAHRNLDLQTINILSEEVRQAALFSKKTTTESIRPHIALALATMNREGIITPETSILHTSFMETIVVFKKKKYGLVRLRGYLGVLIVEVMRTTTAVKPDSIFKICNNKVIRLKKLPDLS